MGHWMPTSGGGAIGARVGTLGLAGGGTEIERGPAVSGRCGCARVWGLEDTLCASEERGPGGDSVAFCAWL